MRVIRREQQQLQGPGGVFYGRPMPTPALIACRPPPRRRRTEDKVATDMLTWKAPRQLVEADRRRPGRPVLLSLFALNYLASARGPGRQATIEAVRGRCWPVHALVLVVPVKQRTMRRSGQRRRGSDPGACWSPHQFVPISFRLEVKHRP